MLPASPGKQVFKAAVGCRLSVVVTQAFSTQRSDPGTNSSAFNHVRALGNGALTHKIVITTAVFWREESAFLPQRAYSRSLAYARDDNLPIGRLSFEAYLPCITISLKSAIVTTCAHWGNGALTHELSLRPPCFGARNLLFCRSGHTADPSPALVMMTTYGLTASLPVQ